jgi:hypothetical protein
MKEKALVEAKEQQQAASSSSSPSSSTVVVKAEKALVSAKGALKDANNKVSISKTKVRKER